MNIQLRKHHLLIQHFMILQLRHTSFITQSLKEIHSGCETGLIDTGPFQSEELKSKLLQSVVAQDLKLKIVFSQVNFQNKFLLV